MSSRPYKIFTMQPQNSIMGRNANIASSMIKKADMTIGIIPQRNDSQPFSGYSFPTTQNSLSSSQVSDYNGEGLKKLIREEIQKKLKDDKQKNDIGIMKAEIKSLKESFQELSKISQQKLNESSSENRDESQMMLEKIMKEHEKQTALNLKKVVNKMHEDLKKDLMEMMNKQFIPNSFIEDLQKQLNDMEDKIELIQSKVGQSQKKTKDPVILAETVDLRINKLDREIQNIRKNVLQFTSKVRLNEETLHQFQITSQQDKQTISFQVQKLKNSFNEKDPEFKKINNLSLSNQNTKLQIQLLKTKITQLQSTKEQHSSQIIQLSKKYSNSSIRPFNPTEIMLDSSVNLSTSIHQQILSPNNKIKLQNQNSKSPQPNNLLKDQNVLSSPQSKQISKQPVIEKQSKKKLVYKIDSEGYIMDENGIYLVDQKNQMILLIQEKLKRLQQSNLIQFV